jgi:hypothetical protein
MKRAGKHRGQRSFSQGSLKGKNVFGGVLDEKVENLDEYQY